MNKNAVTIIIKSLIIVTRSQQKLHYTNIQVACEETKLRPEMRVTATFRSDGSAAAISSDIRTVSSFDWHPSSTNRMLVISHSGQVADVYLHERIAMASISNILTRAARRAGSGVVRIDPLRFLAGCRTRRLNQVLSVLSLA